MKKVKAIEEEERTKKKLREDKKGESMSAEEAIAAGVDGDGTKEEKKDK